MTSGSEYLYSFLENTVKGLVSLPLKVRIEVVESGSKTVTLVIHADPQDIPFLYDRFRAIRFLSIGIAQRHKVMVNVIINE